MIIRLLSAMLTLCLYVAVQAQTPTLDYYLPKGKYDPAIPTPSSWLGYEVGQQHVSHDQLLGYMKALDASSERISMLEYGRSHENRSLVCLVISDPANHKRLEEIQEQRAKLCDPDQQKKLDLKQIPAVYYMGYSIHGNEASGSNAALLVAWHLAASQEESTQNLLKNTVILLDPCFNPDGLQRFSSWVNSRNSQQMVADPGSDQYNEPWPRGRTNHYWFDLNRDWLVAQQPESMGRVALFQRWRPNVLTDHHEMGSNSSFFFQPGVPSRVNPITPKRNQALTAKIAGYHADLLNRNRVLYFTEENFDDFYYGKGSTYPDAQGCIGILFEQASSRGTAQETDNGLLTFPYSIRNQVFVSLSTLKAVGEMREELNAYMADFYAEAGKLARQDEVKGYVFNYADRSFNALEFLNLLSRHHIKVSKLKQDLSIDGKQYAANQAFWVPLDQPQYRLIKGIFNRPQQFEDSIFYDISAWTLPDAFGLDWSPVRAAQGAEKLGDASEGVALSSRFPPYIMADPAYAYAIRPEPYEYHKALGILLKKGLRVKVATKAFQSDNQSYPPGTLLVAANNQALSEQALLQLMGDIQSLLPISPLNNGLTASGPDLGSESFRLVRLPKILLLTGDGVRPEDAGEVWHQFDTRYGIPVAHLNVARLSNANLNKYNVLILADANPGAAATEKIKDFAQNGGLVVATGASLRWLKNANLIAQDFREEAPLNGSIRRPYDALDEDQAARRMPGAIFEGQLDLSHPVCYGYTRDKLPLFLGDALYLEPTKNAYATPVQFTKNPLLAGYVNARQKPLLPGAAAVVVHNIGRGKVIGFPINPLFRAFWLGTNRLFGNAVFFGDLIADGAGEKKG